MGPLLTTKKQFAEKQAYQSLTHYGVYDTNYKRQPSVLNQLGLLAVCVCEQAGRKVKIGP